MKKFVVILCVVLVIYLDSVRPNEIDKLTLYCKGKENATDDEMQSWENNTKPTSIMVKCLNTCVGEKMGLLSKKRLNVAAPTLNYIKTVVKDETVITKYKATLDECKSVTDPDRCEAGVKIFDCLNDAARKRGIKEIF